MAKDALDVEVVRESIQEVMWVEGGLSTLLQAIIAELADMKIKEGVRAREAAYALEALEGMEPAVRNV